jgi:hypothetical protein
LRIHTTIDRPVLLAGADYTVDGLFGSTALKTTAEPTQLDNHCCNRHRNTIARQPAEASCRLI